MSGEGDVDACSHCGARDGLHDDGCSRPDLNPVRTVFSLPGSIALGIPHTPWVPERVESMKRLRNELGFRPKFYREFTAKMPNRQWSREMWQWGLDTGADFFLTLQDDVMVAPCFWPALRAMLSHFRGGSLGLTSVHPAGAEIARRGHRWYRTQAWNVGWAYGMWRSDLGEFIDWSKAVPDNISEDDTLNRWHLATGRFVWHPVPTIVKTALQGRAKYVVFDSNAGEPLQAYESLESAQTGALEWAARLAQWAEKKR